MSVSKCVGVEVEDDSSVSSQRRIERLTAQMSLLELASMSPSRRRGELLASGFAQWRGWVSTFDAQIEHAGGRSTFFKRQLLTKLSLPLGASF